MAGAEDPLSCDLGGLFFSYLSGGRSGSSCLVDSETTACEGKDHVQGRSRSSCQAARVLALQFVSPREISHAPLDTEQGPLDVDQKTKNRIWNSWLPTHLYTPMQTT